MWLQRTVNQRRKTSVWHSKCCSLSVVASRTRAAGHCVVAFFVRKITTAGRPADENVEACALRELREETGVDVDSVEQFKVYSELSRDPRERVITVAHLALVKKCEVVGGDDAANAQWFDINDLPELAFDHQQILDDALEELRCRIHYKPIGFELMPEQFTMSQLKQLYDTILDNDAEHELDRRNFHRKMVTLGIVEPADASAERRERSRIMFRFNKEKYNQFKKAKSGFRPEF